MAKKTETKTEKVEREYVVPLREKCRVVPRYRKTPKAVKTVKEFIAKHMKVYDRDLNKVKLDKFLNEFLWFRGIKNPPHKVKVKVVKDGENVLVSLSDLGKKLAAKKARLEKRESKVIESKKKAKKEEEKPEDADKDGVEDKKEESEKKAAVVEAGAEIEKAQAKQMKHQAKDNVKQPKHQQRKALAK